MAKNYLNDKVVKKNSATKAGWLILVFVLIFAALLAKFALSGTVNNFSGLPDSDLAYNVAKQYILPTTLSRNVKFSDSDYKFAKKSDSVYVIKSFYTIKDNDGESLRTDFTIELKYNGGAGARKDNWSLINLNQDSR
ncbi:hypothetical protein NAF17_06150 [Mucilaginibacter sp. RB4R14]|uniref:hypothetical protein n=1 Tax=Mucilaginibacter aurantiaciroseus TaxID=2949308 RepID=UPI002091A009|nr:hypothetical protein [Mucilaginibacter aurantiaciroseus]MCO5935113.1 hypothetical protein [Mucilaginibacter aurantiaciroseus]